MMYSIKQMRFLGNNYTCFYIINMTKIYTVTETGLKISSLVYFQGKNCKNVVVNVYIFYSTYFWQLNLDKSYNF